MRAGPHPAQTSTPFGSCARSLRAGTAPAASPWSSTATLGQTCPSPPCTCRGVGPGVRALFK